jgi:uroporphyrinogen decarboxylase
MIDKSLLRALSGKIVSPPPLWLMRQAGRYLPEYRSLRSKAGNFLDLCYTPALAAEATLQPVRRFGFDAAILFSDILVIAAALNRKVSFRDGDGPSLEPIENAGDLARVPAPEKLAPVYDALRQVKPALPDQTALIGFAGGPWTVAAYLVDGAGKRGFPRARGWAADEPGRLDAVVSRLADATATHLSGQIEAGAEAVQLFDSWAGLLTTEGFRRFVIAPTRRIVETLKARHPDVPVIGFPRHAGALYGEYAAATGVAALSLDQTVALDQARALQIQLPVQGNLDPEILVQGGAALDRAVRAILDALESGPFVFNLGHGILPGTPLGHVERLMRLVRGGP